MQLKGHTLYHFNLCPYCLKVRLALSRSGFEMELRNIKRNRRYRDELVAGGGKSQVPCLRIEREDGTVQWMYESDDIVRYLGDKVPA